MIGMLMQYLRNPRWPLSQKNSTVPAANVCCCVLGDAAKPFKRVTAADAWLGGLGLPPAAAAHVDAEGWYRQSDLAVLQTLLLLLLWRILT